MKAIVAITALTLMCGQALAGDTGPLPQSGKDHPEVTKGARESGAMETTGKSTRNGKKDISKGAAKAGDVKK